LPEPNNHQQYDLFLAEVIAAQADERVFSEGRWHFEGQDALRTLHHVAGGHFLTIGEPVDGKTLQA
jgi:flavin reductase (DIM6/NTAB) family NADH-FMN oxidoreductase RutF